MTDPVPISTWKKLAIRSLFFGVGFAVALVLWLTYINWYNSRPHPIPANPWNNRAIISVGTPGFEPETSAPEKTPPTIRLRYTLENTTNQDFTITSETNLRIMFRYTDGTLGRDLNGEQHEEGCPVLPVFIPQKQKAIFDCKMTFQTLTAKDSAETDADYHERIRQYFNHYLSRVAGLVIFDDTNHYEIDLPKWASQKPATP